MSPIVLVARIQPKKCTTCRFYAPETKECKVIATQHPVTGTIDFFEATTMRADKNRCGPSAVWYMKNILDEDTFE
jgi:hypothetical protein